jgi:hypothetical protein
MGRGRDRRRERRRARTHAPRPELPEPEPYDRARALAKFRHLRGRAIELRFAPYGPTIVADTPEQLAEMVARALLAETGRSGFPIH